MGTVFITGCCGYIGSHTTVELLDAGYDIIGMDDFSNSKKDVLKIIKNISGKTIRFYEGNMLDIGLLRRIFDENQIDCVIDFAAYKSVGDSVAKPIEYYTNNVSSLLCLLKAMQEFNVTNLIFSSTAAVYGLTGKAPLYESDRVGNTINPYATSKLFAEKILKDLHAANHLWNIIVFRYFNPIGAHKSGLLFEDPKGVPSNLMPHILNVASGGEKELVIYGNTYDTLDGTGVRDYIHVVDLAKAHVKGIEKLFKQGEGYNIYNLGTGIGYSVLEIIKTFEKVNDIKIMYSIGEKRKGDIDRCYASALKAEKELGWKAEKNLEEMCIDAYKVVLNKK